MGMGGGGSRPTPEPEPVPQVPIQDSPNSLEVARQDVRRAQKQDGHSGHLLSGGHKGDTSKPKVSRAKLIG